MNLYSVGEIIILNSPNYPQYNGEYSVAGISKRGQVYKGKVVEARSEDFYYDLGFNTPKYKEFTLWNETCLRKKHEPSQMSFQSIIQSINNPMKQVG